MKKSLFKDITLMFIPLIFILILCELGTRTYDRFNGRSFFNNSHRDILTKKIKKITPFRVFGDSLYHYESNTKELFLKSSHSELYPLVKSDSTFRIVCFGGSTTRNSSAYNKYGIHYPSELQKKLNTKFEEKQIEVINVAYEAYSSAHSLIILMLDVSSWSPDLILFMHNHNDLTASYWPNLTFDYSNKYGANYYQPSGYLDNYTTINFLFRWSSFYWLVKEKIANLINNKSRVKVTTESYGIAPSEMSQHIFTRNLDNFKKISDNIGCNVIFMSQALNLHAENSDFVPVDKSEMIWPKHDEYVQHHNYFNTIINDVAVSTNSYFLDNDLLFSSDSTLFIDALHYSKEGVYKLSQNIYEYIILNKIIK